MSGSDNPQRIRLHYESVGSHTPTLPAYVLVKSLQKVQRIVYLLAKLHRGEELGQRVRVSSNFERRFALICQVPEAGSYVLPAEIGGPSVPMPFDDEMTQADDEIMQVSHMFHQVSRTVNQIDLDALRNQVPDGAYRKSLLEAYKDTQPPKRSGLVFSIEDNEHNKLLDGFQFAHALSKLESRPLPPIGGSTPSLCHRNPGPHVLRRAEVATQATNWPGPRRNLQ